MKTIKIGRQSGNDLVFAGDMSVSRQHAVVTIYDDGRIMIRDLNSSSGTYVDGKRVVTDTALTPTSVIQMGNTTLTLADILKAPQAQKPKKAVVDPLAVSSLTERKTLGRDPANAMHFGAADVSSRHAVLGRDASGQIVVADLGSSNGTFVNGNRIQGVTPLRPGDSLRLAASTPVDWQSQFKPLKKSGSSSIVWISVAAAVVVALIVGVCIWKPWANRPWESKDIYSHYKSSVVMIYQQSTYEVKLNGKSPSSYSQSLSMLDNLCVDSDGEVISGVMGGFGTGFFISDDGRIMTNKHVLYPVGESVKDADKIKDAVASFLQYAYLNTNDNTYLKLASDISVDYVILWAGAALNDTHVSTKDDFLACTPVKKSNDENVDVAILQTNNKKTPEGCQIVDLNDISLAEHRKIGDRVYTIGFPQSFTLGQTEVGLEANNQSGEITQERGENVYGHNMTIHQGASGSPVFDQYGKFAGIVVSGYLGLSQGYNQAVNPEKAKMIANN